MTEEEEKLQFSLVFLKFLSSLALFSSLSFSYRSLSLYLSLSPTPTQLPLFPSSSLSAFLYFFTSKSLSSLAAPVSWMRVLCIKLCERIQWGSSSSQCIKCQMLEINTELSCMQVTSDNTGNKQTNKHTSLKNRHLFTPVLLLPFSV